MFEVIVIMVSSFGLGCCSMFLFRRYLDRRNIFRSYYAQGLFLVRNWGEANMKWYTNPTFWLFIFFLGMCAILLSGCANWSVRGQAEYSATQALMNWASSIGPLIR